MINNIFINRFGQYRTLQKNRFIQGITKKTNRTIKHKNHRFEIRSNSLT